MPTRWIEAFTGNGVEVVDRVTAQTIAVLPSGLPDELIARARLLAAAPALADRLEARACCAVECEDPCDACRADREALRAAGRLG